MGPPVTTCPRARPRGRGPAPGSAADAGNFGGTRPSDQPFAALDGQPGTAWRPPDVLGAAQHVWWRGGRHTLLPARPATIGLAASDTDPPVTLQIATDAGVRTESLRVADGARQIS